MAKARTRKSPCVLGRYCSEHNFVHGAEAEEFREKLEQLIADEGSTVPTRLLQRLLDDVDARDSLAFLEHKSNPRKKQREVPNAR